MHHTFWVSLHNVFSEEMAECGSVALTSHSAGFQAAAASLFIFTQFLGVHEQCEKRNAPRGKVKTPLCCIFLMYYFCIMDAFFKSNSRPSVIFVHTTCTRCAFAFLSQISISSLHSHIPEGGRPAARIMPELFHATGSLNFHIHPHSFVENRA